jgi:hypothetical protein
MSQLSIGVLAEDATDCAAIATLIRRIAPEASIGIERYAGKGGKGCSHLRRKAEARLKDAARRGCAAAIVLHDLDRNPSNGELNDEGALRQQKLEALAVPAGLQRLVCIPVEELEAWFWADPAVVREVGRGRGEAHPTPHSSKRPKEALARLSIGANRKPRYSTNDNAKLAERLDLALCARRCSSFRALNDFIERIVATIPISSAPTR